MGVKLGVPLYWSKADSEGPPTNGKINTTPHKSKDGWARRHWWQVVCFPQPQAGEAGALRSAWLPEEVCDSTT